MISYHDTQDTRWKQTIAALGLAGLLAVIGCPANAVDVMASMDITVELGGAAIEDEQVVSISPGGGVGTLDIGPVPANADVTAFHELDSGDRYFALDTAVELPGLGAVEPRQVVSWDGASHSLAFDGPAFGLARGVRVDALAVDDTGALLLSFDTTVELAGLVFDDEDVVLFDRGVFAAWFDGSALGVAPALDVDGVFVASGGVLGLSFDGSGQIGGVVFDDEDIVALDTNSGAWSLHVDFSAEHPGTEASDLNAIAVPEPGFALSLCSGCFFLAVANRGRVLRGRC